MWHKAILVLLFLSVFILFAQGSSSTTSGFDDEYQTTTPKNVSETPFQTLGTKIIITVISIIFAYLIAYMFFISQIGKTIKEQESISKLLLRCMSLLPFIGIFIIMIFWSYSFVPETIRRNQDMIISLLVAIKHAIHAPLAIILAVILLIVSLSMFILGSLNKELS